MQGMRSLSMTRFNSDALSNHKNLTDEDMTLNMTPPITVNEIKDIFVSSQTREKRLETLKAIRLEIFIYDLADLGDGYSSLIAELDRAIGLLELSPVGSADPEILQRVDGINPSK